MKHLFVSYEIAKALEELGFDEPCFGWFTDNYLRIGGVVELKHVQGEDETLAPTYQQVVDWFREKREIIIESRTEYSEDHQRSFVPHIDNKEGFIEGEYCTDYYTALNVAIDEAIKSIKKQNERNYHSRTGKDQLH